MVGKYTAAGMPQHPDGYDASECEAWVDANFRGGNEGGKRNPPGGAKAGAPKNSDAAGLRAAQRRRIEAQARLDELEIQKTEGELLEKAATLAAIREHATIVRQGVERIAPSLAKAIAAEYELASDKLPGLRTIIADEIRKAMVEISRNPLPPSIEGGPETTDPEAPTKE